MVRRRCCGPWGGRCGGLWWGRAAGIAPLQLPCQGPVSSGLQGFTSSQSKAHVRGLNPVLKHIFLSVTLITSPESQENPSGTSCVHHPPGQAIACLQESCFTRPALVSCNQGQTGAWSAAEPGCLPYLSCLPCPAHPACFAGGWCPPRPLLPKGLCRGYVWAGLQWTPPVLPVQGLHRAANRLWGGRTC